MANTAMWLNLGHIGQSTHRRYGDRYEPQNMIVFDIPAAEELIQKP
jgi:hypothetical protein